MLSVSQAVRQRHSVRAFLPRPVGRADIEAILEIASRAPSGGNLQPWHVDVLAGNALEELRRRVRDRLSQGLDQTEFHVYPPELDETHAARRRAGGEALYAAIGVGREDKPARWSQFLRNYELFGAPVGLFFSIDRGFDRPQWAHLGMFIQTIMLLAEERGLGTCAQESWAAAHATVSEFLELPPDRILYCGLALGYPDREHPINRFRTEREPLSGFARFRGMG
ncbi:MAG TPA: nitroreductase [Allosphingosinicella sp.]|jgi:nitroreductase|uniref:nitroreductase n=1 Tax=Allosphingosinicella sp. TaxID=2823234 RepID=UPI002F2AAD98